MKTILVIGLGRFGRHIAMKLNELNHQVMAVDMNEERVSAALPYVTSGQIGDSTNKEFLSTLGVPDFDTCIVAIGDDFLSSLQTAALLKELGAKQVVARVSTGVQEKFLLRNGADEVVYPEKQMANWTAIRCTSYHILDYIELDGDLAYYEVEIPENWRNHTVGRLDVRRKYGVTILGVRQGGRLDMAITPDTLLPENASILVVAREEDVQRWLR